MGDLIGIAVFCWDGDIGVGIAEAKLAEMADEMATYSFSSLAGTAEAKPAKMAARMAAVCANSIARIAEAKNAEMVAKMATVSANGMAGKFGGRALFSAASAARRTARVSAALAVIRRGLFRICREKAVSSPNNYILRHMNYKQ